MQACVGITNSEHARGIARSLQSIEALNTIDPILKSVPVMPLIMATTMSEFTFSEAHG
jgi:hypothetical protein